jgi:hypothetical protein
MAIQPALPNMEAIARRSEMGEILALAVQNNASAEAIERLVNLQQSLIAKDAEREFNECMNRCQSEMRAISTDGMNPETRSKYATYRKLDSVLRPIYTKFGISISYSTTDCPIPEYVRVLAYVSLGGFTRTYQCDISSDGKGPKGGAVMSKTHASGSAMSYGMRYLLKMIFNVAVGEDDDDGNGGADFSEQIEWIANAKDMEELKRLYFQAKADAGKARATNALRLIEQAKNARKAELQ